MDIVYLYRHTSSEELIYSVKLLKKFYKDVGQIWVVGDRPPKAICDDVYHVYHSSGLSKWADQLDKIRRFSIEFETSDRYVIFNDDFFLTDDFNPKLYRSKDLPKLEDIVKSRRHDPYTSSIGDTIEYLKDNGMSTFNFELHVPMAVDRMLVNSLLVNIEQGVDLQFRSLYGNSYPAMIDGSISDVKNIELDQVDKYLSTSNVEFNRYKNFLEELLK